MNIREKMKNISSWFYRGEGNDTIVIGLRGENRVLRLKKRANELFDHPSSFRSDQDYFKEIMKSLDFSKKVFLPLMSGKYVRTGEIVSLPKGFAAKMDEMCRPFRPKHRLHKSIDASATFAVLMPDFCFLPNGDHSDSSQINSACSDISPGVISKQSYAVFSVEIKPKCGFLPTSPHIRPEHQDYKYNVCHYCMLQYLKVSEGKYTRPSRYCPVNMFSSDSKHVLYALQALIADPQNNLRIFKDGSPIYTQEMLDDSSECGEVCCPEFLLEKILKESDFIDNCLGSVAKATDTKHKCGSIGFLTRKFLEIVIRILIHDSNTGVPGRSTKDADTQEVFYGQVCKGNGIIMHANKVLNNACYDDIGDGGVLHRLLSIQKLDNLDVEGIHPLYLKLQSHFECNPGLREKLGVDNDYGCAVWKNVVKMYQSTCTSTPQENDAKEDLSALLQLDLNDEDSLHKHVLKVCQFCVASTAKDCSLMVSFQRKLEPPSHVSFIGADPGGSGVIVYNLDLVDLDPKEIDRVTKYMKDTCKVVSHYKADGIVK